MSALKDIAERVLRTAAQAFVGAYGLDLTDVISTSNAEKAGLTAASAVLALVMGLVGSRMGSSPDDASLR
jgi:hypothetical protein